MGRRLPGLDGHLTVRSNAQNAEARTVGGMVFVGHPEPTGSDNHQTADPGILGEPEADIVAYSGGGKVRGERADWWERQGRQMYRVMTWWTFLPGLDRQLDAKCSPMLRRVAREKGLQVVVEHRSEPTPVDPGNPTPTNALITHLTVAEPVERPERAPTAQIASGELAARVENEARVRLFGSGASGRFTSPVSIAAGWVSAAEIADSIRQAAHLGDDPEALHRVAHRLVAFKLGERPRRWPQPDGALNCLWSGLDGFLDLAEQADDKDDLRGVIRVLEEARRDDLDDLDRARWRAASTLLQHGMSPEQVRASMVVFDV